MKNIFLIICVLFFSCKDDNDKYFNKFPFFKNIKVYKDSKTVSLNNFVSYKNVSGLEYLLNENGDLLEIHNWKNNKLNGYTYLYSSNNRISVIANFINDTLSGNYYVLDTINGKLESWEDKVNYGDEESAQNQNVNFINNRIDLSTSWFHVIKKENDSCVCIYLPTMHQFAIANITIIEAATDRYIFETDSINDKTTFSGRFKNCYLIKNRKSKYLVGKIIYSIMPEDYIKRSVISRTSYFKIKL